jgi:hypothetical protein
VTEQQRLRQSFEDLWLRTEKIFHLGTCAPGGIVADDLQEDLEDFGDCIPGALGLEESVFEDADEALDAINSCEKFGFLGQFTYATKRNGWRSWALCQVIWLYAETTDELLQKALDWAAQCFEQEGGD